MTALARILTPQQEPEPEPPQPNSTPEPTIPTINGVEVNERTRIRMDHSAFGPNSSRLINPERTNLYLCPIADVLLSNNQLAITIQILTNLNQNQLNQMNSINGGKDNGTMNTVMRQRGQAIQRALLNMGVPPELVVFMFQTGVPDDRTGIIIRFRSR